MSTVDPKEAKIVETFCVKLMDTEKARLAAERELSLARRSGKHGSVSSEEVRAGEHPSCKPSAPSKLCLRGRAC